MHTAARRQWYQRIDAVHELTDGRLVATERDCHPDSIAEAAAIMSARASSCAARRTRSISP